jgi:hypothetical protein
MSSVNVPGTINSIYEESRNFCNDHILCFLKEDNHPERNTRFDLLIKMLSCGDKLRVIEEILVVDDRSFQSLSRKITGDSRFVTLEHLKKYRYINDQSLFDFISVVNILKITYKDDIHFVKSLSELIEDTAVIKECSLPPIHKELQKIVAEIKNPEDKTFKEKLIFHEMASAKPAKKIN